MTRAGRFCVSCLLSALFAVPVLAQDQSADRLYMPEQIRSISVESFLARMVPPEPGYQRFAALNALIQKGKESEGEARRSLITTVTAAMLDDQRLQGQRWQCCYVLGGIGDEQVVPTLTQAMLHDAVLSPYAAEALGTLAKEAKSAAAHDALRHAAGVNQGAREVLARQFGEVIAPAEGVPIPALGNATYTAEEIEHISAETFLHRMLYPEPNRDTFDNLDALLQKAKASDAAGKEQVLALVRKAMRDPHHPADQRWQCCHLLGACRDERGIPDLIFVLEHDPSETMRATAADALAEFPQSAPAHEALLQAARGETNPTVREALVRRLGKETPAGPPAPAGVEERAPTGPPQPPPAPAPPISKPLPWPFPGGQQDQHLFNNYQQATDAYIHCGLDFLQPAGTPVLAVASGYVAVIATNYPEWTTHHFFIATPEEGGSEGWCYTHLDPATFTFAEGDYLRQGQRLGSLVDFSVGKAPGVSHLHLNYVRFSRDASGKVTTRSLRDPLYYFDWKDTEPPAFQPLRFVAAGTTQPFAPNAAGVITVSGKVDVLAALTDRAYPDHAGNWGVPVVMLSISDGTHTMQKLVVDHRGEVGDETRVRPLYLSSQEERAFIDPDSFPRYKMLRVTKTDGDGVITWRDESQCWDTEARGPTGRRLWPNGAYAVNVYAWDVAGHRAVVGAVVKVRNR